MNCASSWSFTKFTFVQVSLLVIHVYAGKFRMVRLSLCCSRVVSIYERDRKVAAI